MRRTWLGLGIGCLALTSGCAPPAPAPRAASAPAASPAELPPTKRDGTPYLWRAVAIRGGGFVTGVAFSPVERDLAYARTDVGGAYRYDGKTREWTPLTDMFGRVETSFTSIESIAPDPRDPNKVYAAAGSYVARWAPNGVILRSSDRGATWARTQMPFRMGGNEAGRSIGERLAVDPRRTDVLFFASRQRGLWRSSDAAVTWTQVESFPIRESDDDVGLGFVLFDANSGADGAPTPTLYVGVASGSGGVYVSHDAGLTWRALPRQPQNLIAHHAALDADGLLYLSYANGPGPQGLTRGAVYRFDPKSGLFSNITPVTPTEDDPFGYAGLALDPRHPGTLLVTTMDRWARGDEIFRSSDRGRHWTPLLAKALRSSEDAAYLRWGKEQLGPPGWMGDIALDPFDSRRALLASGRGVWSSDDVTATERGQRSRWTFNDRGLEQTIATRVVSPPRGAALLSGVGELCGFRHDDLEQPPPRGMFANPVCHTTTGLDYAALEPERIARVGNVWGEGKHGALSSDGGSNWVPFQSEPEGSEGGGVIAVSADGSTLLWVVKRGPAAYSSDQGASWHTVSGLPLPQNSAGFVPVNLRAAADRVDSRKFYVFDCAAGTLYVSDDGARRFSLAVQGLPVLADWEQTSGAIETMPGVEGEIWLSTGEQVYRSIDAGRSFQALASVEESYALGFGRAAPDRANLSVFLSGRVKGTTGFFRSDDLGATWVRLNDDQHQFGFVSAISGDLKRFGRVYIGSGGRGILYGDPR